MQNHKSYRAFFVVPPEVQLLDITGPAHIFYSATEYDAPVQAHYLSLNGNTEEHSCAGVSLGNLQRFQDFELNQNDWVIIPGLIQALIFDKDFEQQNQPFFKWLHQQHKMGAKICSVCTGAYLLAQSGLLNGRQCTTHWKYLNDFRSRFSLVELLNDRLFVKDGSIYSSAGVASGIDLSLFLLEEVFGPVFATKVAKEVVVYIRRTTGDPQMSVFLQYRNHLENRVHQVQDYLAQNLNLKQKVDDLASVVNMSPRNLTRLFKQTTGITIGQYTDKLRVERAVQLLSEGQKVAVVAKSCGLNSSNQLRSLLKKHASVLPHEIIPS